MSGPSRLRALLDPSNPCIAMSTHSPLSALLAARTPFPALWVSGFELAALHGVPDANIISYDTHLNLVRAISDVMPAHHAVPPPESHNNTEPTNPAVQPTTPSPPLIADLDTGHGNAVNITYIVPKYARAGASAVVIEDKTFPKDSSLRPGGRQVLVSIQEFVGKIRAAKAAARTAVHDQRDALLVIARTEALIAGLGLAEARRRGMAYAAAGADAVLVHSKSVTAEEVVAFCEAWPEVGTEVEVEHEGKRVRVKVPPLVIVPTSYPEMSFEEWGKLGKVGLVICGNHAVRAAVRGMTDAFRRIKEEGGIKGVEGDIVGVEEIFELQGDREMRMIEREFLR
ncbi:Phosphonopyruvate hydrolase [Cyphellophora attinorum]|uniref:Phosphonopyruvate hydrolase n=1 Tax=Cyphellophora attinorum TaxID=1664694 RepID=A0A0N1P189_9EURO|nr:Phosphonopyruvate hydrolase [Phialophora attinorum]KPI43296.1 Phosphonopyruvate hydrolase [Phialophora attinorum]